MIRGKKYPKERRVDRSLLSGVKSDGFRVLYISLLWEEKLLSYSGPSYKTVTYKTAQSYQAASPKGRQ